jgi:hypothetical protein
MGIPWKVLTGEPQGATPHSFEGVTIAHAGEE